MREEREYDLGSDTPDTTRKNGISIILFDGKFADNMAVLQIQQKLVINMNSTTSDDETLKAEAYAPEVKAAMYKFSKWELVDKTMCYLQLKIDFRIVPNSKSDFDIGSKPKYQLKLHFQNSNRT